MPTVLSHIAVPLALGLGLGTRAVSPRLLVAGVIASAVPDLDVVTFRFGIAYDDVWGHRGASHSLAFAVLLGCLAAALASRLRATPGVAFGFVAVAAASHGLLDMLTNGGLGVALWWPLSDERLFFPWRVIEASPLNLRRVLGGRGIDLFRSEVVWVWLPALAVFAVLALRRRHAKLHPSSINDHL